VPNGSELACARTQAHEIDRDTCCLKTAAIALSLEHIFILISFQVLAPLRRGSLFLPGIVARWPAARITLRQAARVIEHSRRL
jgi:hypothetical protein